MTRLTKGTTYARGGGGKLAAKPSVSVVAAPSNKEGKHYGVQGSHSVVKQAPTKHLYGMGGIRSMKLHPHKGHTETGHKVVSAPILKGATLKKN